MRATHLAIEALVAERSEEMDRVMGRDGDDSDAVVDVLCVCDGIFCISVRRARI